MTRGQKKWLAVLQQDGFVPRGSFPDVQHHRCLWALTGLGYCTLDWGPEGSFLQTQGWVYTPKGA